MNRPDYLSNYNFDWDLLDVVIGGKSSFDTKFFVGPIADRKSVVMFLQSYGLDPDDPVNRAELFGNFQEAMQFIRRYFLKDGNSDGLDYQIPNSLYMITDVTDLFLMGSTLNTNTEERLWAEVILKIMHTILHIDKDLRTSYFPEIQTQIFDRFYKYVHRDDNNMLFLGEKNSNNKIPLVNFETKSKKTRESVIIKLLHKAENVAEELFDRIGVRFITQKRVDAIRVVKFLIENSIVIPHNIKPSRSFNSLMDMELFRGKFKYDVKHALKNSYNENQFLESLENSAKECFPYLTPDVAPKNLHSSKNYKSIQFTGRQLIIYKNPFLQEFYNLRKDAKNLKDKDNQLAEKILGMDVSNISKDVYFFYPFEVQVVDEETHKINMAGEASHRKYKQAQLKFAMNRLFKSLIEYKTAGSAMSSTGNTGSTGGGVV